MMPQITVTSGHTILEVNEKLSVQFVVTSDHKFWEVCENIFMAGGVQPHCDQWPHDLRDLWELIHIQIWLKLVVTSGHTIWEDNEKLFTARSGQSSLWPVDTLFESSLRSYSWLEDVTAHCDQWPQYLSGQWDDIHNRRCSQHFVTRGHNIWVVNEKLFMTGGVHSMMCPMVTLFGRLVRS